MQWFQLYHLRGLAMKLFNKLFNKKNLVIDEPFFFRCKDLEYIKKNFPHIARGANEFICSGCGKEFHTLEDHLSYCPYCGCKNE